MSAELGNIFERRFPNQREDLNRVTEEAVEFLEESDIGGQAIYKAHLAIEEMGTNLLKYGYDDTAAHEILLRLEIRPGLLLLLLEDDGHEFNPLLAPEPDVTLPVEQRTPGGLGIYLVRSLVDEMHYQRSAGRNQLTVKIRS